MVHGGTQTDHGRSRAVAALALAVLGALVLSLALAAHARADNWSLQATISATGGGGTTFVTGVNKDGTVVGFESGDYESNHYVTWAFRWNRLTGLVRLTPLDPGCTDTRAMGITDARVVAGYSCIPNSDGTADAHGTTWAAR